MCFSTDLFLDYYRLKRIDKKVFLQRLGVKEKGFIKELFKEIQNAVNQKDALKIEFLMHAIYFWKDEIGSGYRNELLQYVDQLNELLLMEFHKDHENIVILLDYLSDEKSISFLEKAINQKKEYLNWDDNYAFEKRSVWAIYKIGGEKASEALKRLTKNENKVVSDLAIKKLEEIE